MSRHCQMIRVTHSQKDKCRPEWRNTFSRDALTLLLHFLLLLLLPSACSSQSRFGSPSGTAFVALGTPTDIRMMVPRSQLCGLMRQTGVLISDVQIPTRYYVQCLGVSTISIYVYDQTLSNSTYPSSSYFINLPPANIAQTQLLIQNPITSMFFSCHSGSEGFYAFSSDQSLLIEPGSFAQLQYISMDASVCSTILVFGTPPMFLPQTQLLLLTCMNSDTGGSIILFDASTNSTVRTLNTSQIDLGAVARWSLSTEGDELILMGDVFFALYNLTEDRARFIAGQPPLASDPPNILSSLNGTEMGCTQASAVVLDRVFSLFIASCGDASVHRWFLSSTNEIIGPINSADTILQNQLETITCGASEFLWRQERRTLYSICETGSEVFIALQQIDHDITNGSSSVIITSLIDTDTCLTGGSASMSYSRIWPDAFLFLCYSGLIFTQGAAVTSIASNMYNSTSFTSPMNPYYDPLTDAVYLQYANYSLARVHNQRIEPFMTNPACFTTDLRRKIYFASLLRDPASRSLLVSCWNSALTRLTLTNVSIDHPTHQSLIFSSDLFSSLFAAHDPIAIDVILAHSTLYVLTRWQQNGAFDILLLTYFNGSDLVPFVLTDPMNGTNYSISSLVECGEWLIFIDAYSSVIGRVKPFEWTSPEILHNAATTPSGLTCDTATIPSPSIYFVYAADMFAINQLLVRIDLRNPSTTIATTESDDSKSKHELSSMSTLINITNVKTTAATTTTIYAFSLIESAVCLSMTLDRTLRVLYIECEGSLFVFHIESSTIVTTVALAQLWMVSIQSIYADSYSSQVFVAVYTPNGDIFDTYDQLLLYSSGFRCAPGTTWTRGSCQPCPTATSRSGAISSFNSSITIPQCVACGTGSVGQFAGQIECTICAAGRFADTSIGQVCSFCNGGYYSNQSGSISCLPCESGRFSNMSEASFCYSADLGSYVSDEGQSMQFQCPPGRYSNMTNSNSCIECEIGRYAPIYGASFCQFANAGYFIPLVGQNSPSQCPSGRYSNTSGLTFCYECEPGRYAAEYGQFNCSEAEGGYFISLTGQNSQSQCPSGRFSNMSSLSFCYECQPGRYAIQYGSLNCVAADEGYYVDHSSQRLQRPCLPGTFNHETGATLCHSCMPGRFASSTNSTRCELCLLGRFSGSGASDCPTCSVDAYTPRIGADCISCTNQDGLLCINGLASVAVDYWAYLINDTSDPTLQVYRTTPCPPGYCEGAALQFANETSLNQSPQFCVSPRLNSPDNWLCAECEEGYIAWGSSCQPCTGSNVGLICGALILSFVLVYILLRMNPSASPLTILVFFTQIAALELGNITKWIDWIHLSNPGARSFTHCLAPLTPIQQMLLTLLVPFLLTFILTLMSVSHHLLSMYVTPSVWYQSAISSPVPSRLTRLMSACSFPYNRDRYIGTINAILIFCYTSITVTVASALHCVEVGPDTSRLFRAPSIDCQSTEYRTLLLPFVYVWLSCYVIGLPVFMLLFVWRRLQTVITVVSENSDDNDSMSDESLLSASSSSDDLSMSAVSFSPDTISRLPEDRPIHPHQLRRSASTASISFHLRWGHLYRPYRVGAWYWQPIEMMQRFVFALISILLIEHSSARYALYGTLTIVSLILQLQSRPFASDRLNQFALVNYFLLVIVAFLLSGQKPPYTLGVQILMFLLIVPFSATLLVYGLLKTVLDLRTSKPPPSSDSDVSLQPSSSSHFHRRISHAFDLAEPLVAPDSLG